MRAYAHRHGAGPLVTEDSDLSDALPELHNRDGRWQGRFRVGWLDLPAIRYGIAINRRVDALVLTCLDRLSGLDEIRVCVAYDYRGEHREQLDEYLVYEKPGRSGAGNAARIHAWNAPERRPEAGREQLARLLERCAPVYRVFDGWSEDISRATSLVQLPRAARTLIAFLRSDEGFGAPIAWLSVGPSRTQTITLDP